MIVVLVSKCFLDIEQYVEFKMSVLISLSKSLITRFGSHISKGFNRGRMTFKWIDSLGTSMQNPSLAIPLVRFFKNLPWEKFQMDYRSLMFDHFQIKLLLHPWLEKDLECVKHLRVYIYWNKNKKEEIKREIGCGKGRKSCSIFVFMENADIKPDSFAITLLSQWNHEWGFSTLIKMM